MKKRKGIPEGFRRQRLVVLPPAVRARMGRHALLRDLMVTDAGVFPHAENHLMERDEGVATHLVLVCLAGRGWVRFADGEEKEIGTGDLAWLAAGWPHAYGASEAEPWTIEWAHFGGATAEAWRELLGIGEHGGVLRLGAEGAARLRLGEVWAYLETGYSLAPLASAAAALRLALAAAVGAAGRSAAGDDPQERVAATLERMRERLKQPMRLEEMAALAGLSVPHYCVLFRKRVGFSPVDWFNRLRIQRACELLDTTKLSIHAVAAEVGYEDPYYFTRSFRRVMGRAPRAYRGIAKG